MKSFLCAFMMFPICAFADITGTYSVSGYNPFAGKKYTAAATIQKTDETYSIVYNFPDGSVYKGTGVRQGDWICFNFAKAKNAAIQGIVLFNIDDSTLKGPWTLIGRTSIGTEELTKSPEKE